MALINRQKIKQFLLAGVYATPEKYLKKKGGKDWYGMSYSGM